jgi:hypothetical protein
VASDIGGKTVLEAAGDGLLVGCFAGGGTTVGVGMLVTWLTGNYPLAGVLSLSAGAVVGCFFLFGMIAARKKTI